MPPKQARETAFDVLLLLAAAWACHFAYAARFGLYDDDWWRIALTTDLTLREFLRMLWYYLTFQTGQGRPLHESLIYAFSYLGWRMGSLQAIYGIAYTIFAINAVLLYTFLRRISADRFLALTGALAFIVFPADATRPLLTHGLGIQPAITFLLTACLLYRSRWRAASYPIAALSLFCYETCFLPFLALPLLEARRDRASALRILQHAGLMAAILLFAFTLRRLLGEDRATHLDVGQTLQTSLLATTAGPLVALGQYLRGPVLLLQNTQGRITPTGWAIVLACGTAFAVALSRAKRSAPAVPTHRARIAVTGLAMLILAYPLMLRLSPFATTGRESRAHSAAAVGAALIVGAGASAVSGRRLATYAIAAALALAAAVPVAVQGEYALAWSEQKRFWMDFDKLSPPVATASVFLAAAPSPPLRIKSYGWAFPVVLERLYRFPANWRTPEASAIRWEPGATPPPRVFAFIPEWRARYCAGQDLFPGIEYTTSMPYFARYGEHVPRVALVRPTSNGLEILDSPCAPNPAPASPPPGAVPLSTFPKRKLFRLLFP